MITRTHPLSGAPAARLFAAPGDDFRRAPGFPRIALEAPDMAGLARMIETGSAETKSLLTAAGEKLTGLQAKATEFDARLGEIEQKVARPSVHGGGSSETKSLGQRFIESEEFKALSKSATQRGEARLSIETKTLLSGTATWGATGSASNSLVAADRQPLVALPQRPLVIRDLIAPGQTSSNTIEVPVQTGFTNNAAVVAENTLKPTSDITTDLRSVPVRTIAHRMKASRQILDDAPQLQSFIDSQMRYGLALNEEAELLYGDGTGQHLNGIVTQATPYSAPFVVAGETAIDRIALALGQAEVALVPSTGVVLHPLDWLALRLIKDGMGQYLLGSPQTTIAKNLWNVPIATSLAVTRGTFIAGAFRDAAQIFDRLSVEVLISTEDEDNFSKNMVTIRCEERLALAVYRPQGFIVGTLP